MIRVQMSHFSLDLLRSCSRIFENSLLSSALYANETQKLNGRSFAQNARGPRAPSGYVQKFLFTAQVPVSKLRRLLNHDARLPALVGLVAPCENRDGVGMVEFTQWTSSTNTTFWPWGANNPQLWRDVTRHLLSSLLYRVVNIHPGSKNCKSLNSTRRDPIGKLIYNSNNSSLWMFMVRVDIIEITISNGVYSPPQSAHLVQVPRTAWWRMKILTGQKWAWHGIFRFAKSTTAYDGKPEKISCAATYLHSISIPLGLTIGYPLVN